MHALNPMRARAGLRGHRGLRRRIINFKRQNIGNYIAKLQRHPVRARAGLRGHRGLRTAPSSNEIVKLFDCELYRKNQC